MRRTLALTAALIVVSMTGCDPTGPGFDPVDEMRLVIVSGDGQAEQVPASTSNLRISADAAEPLFVEALVAELRDVAGNLATPEPGTLVSFVSDAPDTCVPFTSSDVPDDSARVSTLAEKGTKAGSCHIQARRVLSDGTAQVDTVFTLEVLPGPAHEWMIAGAVNDTIDGNSEFAVRDQYQNPIAWRFEVVDAPVHALSLDIADPRSRMLAADSAGQGTVRAITVAGDSATATLTVTVSGDRTEMTFDRWVPEP